MLPDDSSNKRQTLQCRPYESARAPGLDSRLPSTWPAAPYLPRWTHRRTVGDGYRVRVPGRSPNQPKKHGTIPSPNRGHRGHRGLRFCGHYSRDHYFNHQNIQVMNDKHATKIHNFLTNSLDCAGVDQHQAIASSPKACSSGYYVDVCIENYREEDMMCLIGFLAQGIGMKNIWFDTYPSSGRVHLELNFDEDFLAQ